MSDVNPLASTESEADRVLAEAKAEAARIVEEAKNAPAVSVQDAERAFADAKTAVQAARKAAAPPPEHPFYCPACGRQYDYHRECVGLDPTKPHPPLEVVSTDELLGPEEDHTPAPSTRR